MKTLAAVLRESGRARPYAQSLPLSLEEVELEGPGPGEVLLEVAAAGLCHSDLSVADGSRPRPLPMVLGHEAAGIVREVGAGVTSLRLGDPVVFSYVPSCGRCVPCQSGRPTQCEPGGRANGQGTLMGGARRFRGAGGEPLHHHLGVSAFSRFTVAHEGSLVPIDPAVPLDVAAVFGCAVLTGVGAVVNTARAEPGTSAVIFGLGGVGLAAVMGARLSGCEPIVAVDPLEAKRALALQLGATHAVDARAPDALEQLRQLTGGGAHYAFEAVGSGAVLAQAYAALRRGGTVVAMGLPHPSQMLQIPAVSLVAEEKTLKGSYMGSAVPRRDIPRFMALYRAGRLPVERLLSGTVRPDELNGALDALAEGRAVRQMLRFA